MLSKHQHLAILAAFVFFNNDIKKAELNRLKQIKTK